MHGGRDRAGTRRRPHDSAASTDGCGTADGAGLWVDRAKAQSGESDQRDDWRDSAGAFGVWQGCAASLGESVSAGFFGCAGGAEYDWAGAVFVWGGERDRL